jgi:hypothetical protein
MGAVEKLQQYFQPNTRSGGARSNDPTGDKRVLVRRYKDVHLLRSQISPSQVSPTIGERLETDIWLPPAEAKRLVDQGVAMFVKNQYGEIITE